VRSRATTRKWKYVGPRFSSLFSVTDRTGSNGVAPLPSAIQARKSFSPQDSTGASLNLVDVPVAVRPRAIAQDQRRPFFELVSFVLAF
jgi:hypothetical protein